MHFLRCMGSKFCVKFQRAPLKFHTKFWTHTLQNMNFTVFYFCVWVTISLNCDVISLSETGPWSPVKAGIPGRPIYIHRHPQCWQEIHTLAKTKFTLTRTAIIIEVTTLFHFQTVPLTLGEAYTVIHSRTRWNIWSTFMVNKGLFPNVILQAAIKENSQHSAKIEYFGKYCFIAILVDDFTRVPTAHIYSCTIFTRVLINKACHETTTAWCWFIMLSSC